MNRTILVFILSILTHLSFAQEDELAFEFKTKASDFEAASNYDEAILEYDKAGKQYRLAGEYDSAYKYFLRGLVIREEVKTDDLAMSYLYLGSINRLRHQYCEAAEQYQNALRVANDSTEIFYGHNNLGSILVNVAEGYSDLSVRETLLDSAVRSLQLAEKYYLALPSNIRLEYSLYWNLGQLEAARGAYEKSREYSLRVIQMMETDSTIRTDHKYASLLNNVGYAEMNLGEYESAKSNLTRAWKLATSIGDLELQQLTLENIRELYRHFDVNQDSLIHYTFVLEEVNYQIIAQRNKSASAEYQYRLMKAEFQLSRGSSTSDSFRWSLVGLSLVMIGLIVYIIQIKKSSNRTRHS